MENTESWKEGKAKESVGHAFLKNLLDFSGYKIMNFGIENHNQEIIEQIAGNYNFQTNKKLLALPDFVVIDPETKESWIVEVKYMNLNGLFAETNTNIALHNSKVANYKEFWKEATLVIVLNKEPYCLCVDVDKIDGNKHHKYNIVDPETKKIKFGSWNFEGIYIPITEKFPKVTQEKIKKTLGIVHL